MLRCRTGDEACRKNVEKESRSGLGLAYREGSLAMAYLWLIRKETGTVTEERGCDMIC